MSRSANIAHDALTDWLNRTAVDHGALLSEAIHRLETLGPPAEAPGQRPLWLTLALTQIAEDIPTFTPPDQPALAWPVLFIIQRLMQAQEQAYQAALNHHPPLPCPVHPHFGSPMRARFRHHPVAVPLTGLGLLLAGYWLPSESQALFHEASDAGIDWRQVDTLTPHSQPAPATQHPPPVAPAQSVVPAQSVAPVQSVVPAQSVVPVQSVAPVQCPEPLQSLTPPTPSSPTAITAPEPHADTLTALRSALIDSVRHLCDHPPCNRNGSAAWVTGETVWVIARLLAERMIQHPALHNHPHLKKRTALYRALLSHGLTVSDHKRPIWKITVRFGTHYQRADVLRIDHDVIWAEGDAPPALASDSVSFDRN